MQKLCNKGLWNACLGERVTKPIWNALSFPSTLPNKSLFTFQGPLHIVFPRGLPEECGPSSSFTLPFPLNTCDVFPRMSVTHTCALPSVMMDGGSLGSRSLFRAASTSRRPACRHTQHRDLCHCPSEWENSAGVSDRRP